MLHMSHQEDGHMCDRIYPTSILYRIREKNTKKRGKVGNPNPYPKPPL